MARRTPATLAAKSKQPGTVSALMGRERGTSMSEEEYTEKKPKAQAALERQADEAKQDMGGEAAGEAMLAMDDDTEMPDYGGAAFTEKLDKYIATEERPKDANDTERRQRVAGKYMLNDGTTWHGGGQWRYQLRNGKVYATNPVTGKTVVPTAAQQAAILKEYFEYGDLKGKTPKASGGSGGGGYRPDAKQTAIDEVKRTMAPDLYREDQARAEQAIQKAMAAGATKNDIDAIVQAYFPPQQAAAPPSPEPGMTEPPATPQPRAPKPPSPQTAPGRAAVGTMMDLFNTAPADVSLGKPRFSPQQEAGQKTSIAVMRQLFADAVPVDPEAATAMGLYGPGGASTKE